MRRSFRFRPRYRAFALGAIGLGLLLIAGAVAVDDAARTLAIAGGSVGVLLGIAYLRSPAWRIEVHVDDDALEVTSSGDRKFRLAWGDVREVIASPSTRTCFVDGGSPDQSLLVPGDGAPAPYDIDDRPGLYDAILARAPADRVREVDLLQR